jgi:hypothetical protein
MDGDIYRRNHIEDDNTVIDIGHCTCAAYRPSVSPGISEKADGPAMYMVLRCLQVGSGSHFQQDALDRHKTIAVKTNGPDRMQRLALPDLGPRLPAVDPDQVGCLIHKSLAILS